MIVTAVGVDTARTTQRLAAHAANRHDVTTLAHARAVIAAWHQDYLADVAHTGIPAAKHVTPRADLESVRHSG